MQPSDSGPVGTVVPRILRLFVLLATVKVEKNIHVSSWGVTLINMLRLVPDVPHEGSSENLAEPGNPQASRDEAAAAWMRCAGVARWRKSLTFCSTQIAVFGRPKEYLESVQLVFKRYFCIRYQRI